MNSRSLVNTYLQTLIQQGERRMAIDDDARGILREWMIAAKKGISRMTAPAQLATPVQQNEGSQAAAPAASIFNPDVLEEATKPIEKPEEDVYLRLPAGDAVAAWRYFETLLPRWQPLMDVETLRSTFVMGQGNRQADIMFVGDAPGFKEEELGYPFAGAAGEKLDGMLKAMGLSREGIYLTYLVKKRPALPRQTTNNRTPNEHEIYVSAAALEAEIRLVQPKVIVALGVVAARGLLKLGEIPLTAYQAEARYTAEGKIPVVVTHHPSYLLRTSDLAERRELWEEMLGVMKLVGLPISEKQAGYFLPKS